MSLLSAEPNHEKKIRTRKARTETTQHPAHPTFWEPLAYPLQLFYKPIPDMHQQALT